MRILQQKTLKIIVLILFMMKLFFNSLSNHSGSEPVDPNIVDVFILTGQSNSRGRALNSDALPSEKAVNPQIQIYNTSANRFEDLNIGVNNQSSNNSLYHGVELYMSVNSANLFGSKTAYLIKYGKGSTCIVEHLPGGSVYPVIWNDYVIEGINNLISQGLKPRVKMIWSQGECDFSNNNTSYLSSFNQWKAQWRTNLGSNLPIVSYQISDEIWATAFLPRTVSQINDDFVSSAATDSLHTALDTKDEGCNPNPDTIHYSYEGQKAIGVKAFSALAGYDGQIIEYPL